MLYLLCQLGFNSGLISILRYPISQHFDSRSYQKIQNLLKHGRKAMATVIKIDYVFTEINSEEMTLHALSNDPAPIEGCWADGGYYRSAYNLDTPLFKVTYAFNPPDDASPDDLYHTIYLPYDPTLALHTGDMLPILYVLNPRDNRHVMSMPFPFPLDRIRELDHVICQT